MFNLNYAKIEMKFDSMNVYLNYSKNETLHSEYELQNHSKPMFLPSII